jgi:D-amino-acid dehydrogenase
MLQRKSGFHIKPQLNFNLLNWLYRFSKNCNDEYLKRIIPFRYSLLNASRKLYEVLLEEEQLNCDWESNGILLLCKEEKSMADFAAANEILKEYDLDAKLLSGKALFEKEPALREDLVGGWLHETDSHLRPEKLVAELKAVILKQGAIIEEGCTIEALDIEGDKVSKIKTSKGNFAADHFVFALGAWSANFARQLKLKIPVQPGKGYSITTNSPTLCPKGMCYFSEKSAMATPFKSGFRIGGLLSFSGFDATIEQKRINDLRNASAEYLKVPLGNHLEEEWTGFRPMSCDDMPIIDRSPLHKNLFLATGHSMLGITMAPITGKLVADMLMNQPPVIDPTFLAVNRFQ